MDSPFVRLFGGSDSVERVARVRLARLKTFLNEVPADRFKTPLKTAEIPKLFTVETFCKMVIRQQKAAPAAPTA